MVKEILKEGNVVGIYKIGNTTVKICDDAYKDKTKEDIQIILRKIQSIRLGSIKQ